MKRWTASLVLLLGGVIAGSQVYQAYLHGQGQPAPVPTVITEVTSYRDLVKKVLPAVVSIETRTRTSPSKARANPDLRPMTRVSPKSFAGSSTTSAAACPTWKTCRPSKASAPASSSTPAASSSPTTTSSTGPTACIVTPARRPQVHLARTSEATRRPTSPSSSSTSRGPFPVPRARRQRRRWRSATASSPSAPRSASPAPSRTASSAPRAASPAA